MPFSGRAPVVHQHLFNGKGEHGLHFKGQRLPDPPTVFKRQRNPTESGPIRRQGGNAPVRPEIHAGREMLQGSGDTVRCIRRDPGARQNPPSPESRFQKDRRNGGISDIQA